MIFNLTKKKIIASNPAFLRCGFFDLAKIISNDFNKNDAIVFQNKEFLFSYIFKLDIDLIFTDIENKACKVVKCSKVRRLYFGTFKASHIICVKSGMIDKINIECGDKFNLNIELTTEFKKKLEKRISEGFVSTPTIMSQK